MERAKSHDSRHSWNLVPTVSAHRVVSRTPFGSYTWTVAGPELALPVASTVISPATIDQPVKTFEVLKLKAFNRNAYVLSTAWRQTPCPGVLRAGGVVVPSIIVPPWWNVSVTGKLVIG
jgi:hypothetical protein